MITTLEVNYNVLPIEGNGLINVNPLVTDPLYLVCMAKNSIIKKEGIVEKISYESVNDRSHS